MIRGFLNQPWFLWAGLAMILSIVWVFVGPHTKMPAAPGFRYFIIRWGHALTWLLRGMNPSFNGTANSIAAIGGLAYLLFVVMTFVVK